MSMSAPGQLNLLPSEFVGNTIDVMEPSMQGLNYHPNGYANNHEQIHSLPGYNMSHHQLSRPKLYNMGEIYATQLHQVQLPTDQYNVDYATGTKAMLVPAATPNMEYQSYMLQNTQQIHKDMNVYVHPLNPLVYTNQPKAQYTEASQGYQAHALPFNGQSSKRYGVSNDSQESGQSDYSKGHSRTSSSNTSTAEYPEPVKPKIATTYWEDEKTLCYQVKARGILVSRREDTDFINGTKLLNVIGMTRGKRDGILKTEKVRTVVKVGSMNLKGVWIPFERAYEFARNEGLDVVLYPLFVKNISEYYNSVGHRLKTDDTTFDDLEVDTTMN